MNSPNVILSSISARMVTLFSPGRSRETGHLPFCHSSGMFENPTSLAAWLHVNHTMQMSPWGRTCSHERQKYTHWSSTESIISSGIPISYVRIRIVLVYRSYIIPIDTDIWLLIDYWYWVLNKLSLDYFIIILDRAIKSKDNRTPNLQSTSRTLEDLNVLV